LKDLQVGDLVQVIDDYKIWTYEVYKVEEAREISDREADLILYTCVWWWDSKLRLLVYAKIIE
jgi:sortase (surface protein transpeptidase)